MLILIVVNILPKFFLDFRFPTLGSEVRLTVRAAPVVNVRGQRGDEVSVDKHGARLILVDPATTMGSGNGGPVRRAYLWGLYTPPSGTLECSGIPNIQ